MPISLRKLRQRIRQELDVEDLLCLLERAVELLPAEQLPELIDGFFDPDALQVDETTPLSLFSEVEAFYRDSLAGVYYESFRVNSRNYMERSRGTINWIAEFHRLMESCLQVCAVEDWHQAQKSFELLFTLLDDIDECRDDIIFFADEGGSWQIGLEWETVLPSYFMALANVAKPKAFAQSVLKVVTNHASYHREQFLKMALEVAKPSQRKSLRALCRNE